MRAARSVAVLLVAMAAATVSPAAAQEATAAVEGEAWNGERAFLELERLQAEVRTLRSLAGVQAALLAWNRVRAEGGAGPAVLSAALCGEPEIEPWCRALSATFGPDAGRAADDGQEGDGER